MNLSRRDLLKGAGAALGAGAVGDRLLKPSAQAQTPKRGGVLRVCSDAEPSGFDPHQTVNAWTMIHLSFTHSRLLKHRMGPGVSPGTLTMEGDLADSWTQPSATTYVFRLRRGVRWHNKPPVNRRELTSEDVKYTFERFLTIKGNPNHATLEQVQRIEALDRYTVRFTLHEPFAWFPDALTATSAGIVPREAVEQYGDLKRPESCVGTGPWVLERYEPHVRAIFVRNPDYFLSGLPYADAVELRLDADPSSRLAAWLAGRYDFGPEYGMVVRRLDLDIARRLKPGLQTAQYLSLIATFAAMKLDKEPFNDVRVRRALAYAANWRELLEAHPYALGHGSPNPAIPAALREWSIPIDQLPPEGRKLYEQDLPEARRLLADTGYPSGLRVPVDTTGGYGPDYMDLVQIMLKNWKLAGVEVDLRLKERGAYLASTFLGKFDKMMIGLRGGWLMPDVYLAAFHLPGHILNTAGVNDPRLTEMIRWQRRTFDVMKRREIVYDIQRYLSQHVYYYTGPSVMVVSAWEPYVRNFAPNIGNDYGGRLMNVWLDK